MQANTNFHESICAVRNLQFENVARAARSTGNGAFVIEFLRAAMLGLVCMLVLARAAAPASAADYPNRPVRWLIGFAAGGPVDIVARAMSRWLSEHFGQQFVVENRAGRKTCQVPGSIVFQSSQFLKLNVW
jgi:hypothetical protein